MITKSHCIEGLTTQTTNSVWNVEGGSTYVLDDVVKTFFFSQFTNEAVESPDHKTHDSFSVKFLWNVQIQILNLPKRPS